jgi:hypothetical protein
LKKSNGCKSRPVKASEQAGSECCHSPGDWWVRSVHSKEAGREDSAPKSVRVANADAVRRAEGSIRDDRNCEGRPEIAGVPSSGHVSKDFPRTQESSPSPLARAVRRTPRETGGDRGRMEEQSYDPVVPAKVGNRRASERSGHGTHWREGGNKVTYLLKET